ncbi:MAG: pentapeptide repeat-containing protein [Solirubrobacteraceae bacterium]
MWPWLLAVLVLALIVLVLALTGGDGVSREDLTGLTQAELESEKLREEIEKLRDEQSTPFLLRPVAITAVTALVAVCGLMATFIGQRREFKRQSEADRNQRIAEEQRRKDEHDKAEKSREDEAERRQEERFAALATALASEAARERVSALVGIEAFLEGAPVYRTRLFTLLRGILTIPRFDSTDRAIARAFVAVLRRRIAESPADARGLDLQDVHLHDVDLSGLALPEINGHAINLAGACLNGASFERGTFTEATMSRIDCDSKTSFRNADFSGAKTDLTEAVLRDCTLVETLFRGARLSSAKLDRADCRGASFARARLQSAHLRGANLTGADFSRADVNDAFFQSAIFNEQTLLTLLTAEHRVDAHFDDDTLAELQRLDEENTDQRAEIP